MDESKKYNGCAAVIFRKEDDKVFIAQRKLTKSYGGGLWETIGGGIEGQDKDCLSCIKREIMEELGVEIKTSEEFKDYSFTTQEGEIFLIKTFIVELSSEPKPNQVDFESWGWFSKDEINNLEFVSNCKERLMDYYLKYLLL